MKVDQDSYSRCPHCECPKLCNMEGEVCCTGCGAVLGSEYSQEEVQSESRLNLYQATGVGTRKVDLECARHIHEPESEISLLSNACVKLNLPIYAAKDASAMYQKIARKKHGEKIEYAEKLHSLAERAIRGLAVEKDLAELQSSRPKGCTRAHTAVFAVHLACKRYGIPRDDSQILEAVRMNFGIKRTFTVLKAYSLNEATARQVGIKCDCDRAVYYVRLELAKLQDRIGTGHLYDRIMRQAVANLQRISDRREDARAHRAVNLALRGARNYVQV